MTRDLESALREAREEIAIQRCHYAVSSVAWKRSGKIIDRIDAALSAASGEARGDDDDKEWCAGVAGHREGEAPDHAFELTARSGHAQHVERRDVGYVAEPPVATGTYAQGDTPAHLLSPRPAPSEAPNVDHERIWLQPMCCAVGSYEGRLWCEDPDPTPCEDGVAWTEYVRADLFDTARAEGIAAERERCAKVAYDEIAKFSSACGVVAAAIREAKP